MFCHVFSRRGSQDGSMQQLPAATVPFTCGRCVTNHLLHVHKSARELVRHFIEVHNIPLMYYEEPIILELGFEQCDQQSWYPVIISYGYKVNQYYLLIIERAQNTVNASLYSLDQWGLGPVQFQFCGLPPGAFTCNDCIITNCGDIDKLWRGKNPPMSQIMVDQNSRYVFTMKHTDNNNFELIGNRLGCSLCWQDHLVFDCPVIEKWQKERPNCKIEPTQNYLESNKFVKSRLNRYAEHAVASKYTDGVNSIVTRAQSAYFKEIESPPQAMAILWKSDTVHAY